jgi:hypothetical protein
VNRPGFRDQRTQNARRIFAADAGTSMSAERRIWRALESGVGELIEYSIRTAGLSHNENFANQEALLNAFGKWEPEEGESPDSGRDHNWFGRRECRPPHWSHGASVSARLVVATDRNCRGLATELDG